MTRIRKGLLDEALAEIEALLELDPKHAAAYNNRGVVHRRKGRHLNAIAEFSKAIAEKADYFESLNNRGSVRSQQGDLP